MVLYMLECKHCFQPIEKLTAKTIYMRFSIVKEWYVHIDNTLNYKHQAELMLNDKRRK
jgi:hypothetical protein